jgi:prepilin-type N-terminal cleavage/methylation domain-containing protein
MTPTRSPLPARPGFTLVELLIVIAIIAILVSLAVAAVYPFLGKGAQTMTRVEIGQLETAIMAARTDLNNVPFLPSSIKLDETCAYPQRSTVGSADWFAVTFLQKVFGKRINLVPMGQTQNMVTGTGIDWNGDGQINTITTLQGHKALVFWLGGIPAPGSPPGCRGFNTDPTNPGLTVTAKFNKKPYFDFKPARLVTDTDGFMYYLDAYETGAPYVYLAAGTSGYTTSPSSDFTQVSAPAGALPIPLQPVTVMPYTTLGGQPINPNGFQIISAGKKGQFGPGGPWDTVNGYPGTSPGADDQANFSSALLGTGQS